MRSQEGKNSRRGAFMLSDLRQVSESIILISLKHNLRCWYVTSNSPCIYCILGL